MIFERVNRPINEATFHFQSQRANFDGRFFLLLYNQNVIFLEHEQSNDGSFRSFSVQSITKRDSAFPRAHTCFNKLDLPMYETKKELEECLGLCICFELTGFTID